MGVEYDDINSRSSFDDDDDDPEAALNPTADDHDNDNVAPLFRLRRLARVRDDADPASLPRASNVMSVYVTMHRIRRLVMSAIDDTYTYEELRGPHMDHQVVRPLVDRLYNPEDAALGLCLGLQLVSHSC